MNLRTLASGEAPNSLSNRLRRRRFARFEALTASCPKPLRVIDIGGVSTFWERCGWANRADVEITLVNLTAEPRRYKNITSLAGDATNLSQHPDKAFDIAFSNSVIEHLFTEEKQAAMAREVQRVATAFWVQTPNYWFPVEPHFHVVGWQWMPEALRVAVLRRRRCGWRGPCPDLEEARRYVREVRLLTRNELESLFPGATICPERLFGFVKSWVVTGGFET